MPIRVSTDGRPNAGELVREQFFYNVEFNALAAGASSQGSFTVQADADFIIVKTTRTAVVSTALDTFVSPNVTLVIVDTGSGRQIMDIATHCEQFFGTAQFPYILPVSKRVSASSAIQVTVNNLSATLIYTLKFCFSGFKEYIYQP